MNVRLDIEYDGRDFHGWQRQLGHPTIQSEIEDCLAKVVGRKVTLYGASRTDSGVHAQGQVANFYVEDEKIPGWRWAAVLNYMLPRTIRIRESTHVDDSFHAQKDALTKVYEYRLLNRRHASALDRRVHFYPRNLDFDAIRAALPEFVGLKDFRAFQGAKAEVRTTVRRVIRFELHQEYEGLYKFRIEGNGFLKQMVRTVIGTLLEVGEGKRRPEEIRSVLASLDRDQAGRTVPPHGLCLVCIEYGESKPYVP